jgi:hypothetical protein
MDFELDVFDRVSMAIYSHPNAYYRAAEVFGPVLIMMVFDAEEDVVRLANDSEYGLARVSGRGMLIDHCALQERSKPAQSERTSGLSRWRCSNTAD